MDTFILAINFLHIATVFTIATGCAFCCVFSTTPLKCPNIIGKLLAKSNISKIDKQNVTNMF